MKNTILILALLAAFGCKQKESSFSGFETKMLDSIGFEREVFAEIKQYANTDFKQFETADPGFIAGKDGQLQKTGVVKQNGISFKIPEDRTDEIIFKFKDKLSQNGFLIFLSGREYGSPSTISIIKTADHFDILRFQKTDGANYDLANEDVIKKLKDWDKRYGIEILGADYDWVDVKIKGPVNDISKFAKEIYDFCPDVIDQGVGDINGLERILQNDKRLFLWWD